MVSKWSVNDSTSLESRSDTGSNSGLVPKPFSIFHLYLKSHLRSKIVRISWKFGQQCKISQIILIYYFFNLPPTLNVIFRFLGQLMIRFFLKSTGTFRILQEKKSEEKNHLLRTNSKEFLINSFQFSLSSHNWSFQIFGFATEH